ncbi:ATP-grasp domain-containing protein [Kitasatospora azatica]|uniref:ATP-grasp domain-containing protein n=1 Tax=Kitasatospora azatica TaxID=58347 RepID=UPI0006912EDC|nr:ATP-grasp domain-containing protein [Kitasatospora azatica]
MPATTVLVIEPGSSGVGLVDAARRLGLRPHVFDRRERAELPPPVQAALAEGGADFTRLEIRDHDVVLSAAASLHSAAELVAVVPGYEYAVETCALVADKLGLPGIDPVAARALRDKRLMKRALIEAGVPVAPGAALGSGDDAATVLASVGTPAVAKPVDGSGSQLVRRIDTLAELREHVAAVLDRSHVDLGQVIAEEMLIERYVAGPEYSVEGYLRQTPQGPQPQVSAVTSKQLGPEPSFVEIGHLVDAPLTEAERALLVATAERAVRALGITVGAFHLEARLTPAGPVVMEVGARLGGDRIPWLVRHAWGFDLWEAAVRSHAGLPQAAPDPTSTPVRCAAIRYFTTERSAVLLEPRSLTERLRGVKGCTEVEVAAAPETRLGPACDFRGRFGHTLLVADSHPELSERLEQVDELVRSALRLDQADEKGTQVDIPDLQVRVREIIAQMSPSGATVAASSDRLVEDLGYDSLTLLDLAIALEDELVPAAIDEEAGADLLTVGDVEELMVRMAPPATR